MPSVKEYKAKLASTANTRKITKTMKMVAASKVGKTTLAAKRAKDYAQRLDEMISRVAASADTTSHPLLQARAKPRKCLIVVYTSDKGMCGGFNSNIIKFTQNWIATEGKRFDQVDFSFCGRRGFLYFRNRGVVRNNYEGVTQNVSYANASKIAKDLTSDFLSGEYDEVYLAYNHFLNQLVQKPAMNYLLPIEPHEVKKAEQGFTEDYILEPSQDEILDRLLPKTIEFLVYYALLENAAGENGARMTAMDAATRNADDMIKMYTLLRNRARQASITKELIEIVSGAEALKG